MRPKITVIMPVYNCADLVERALNSIPASKDIQVVVVNDGSTDNSWHKIVDWHTRNYDKFNEETEIHNWTKNRGVASAVNLGYDRAVGEYVVLLSSDDYFISDFSDVLPFMDGKNDLIYFNIRVNDGSVWSLDEKSKKLYVGSVKFIRREFMGDTRNPDKKWHEDVDFTSQLMAKNPREVFTGLTIKHYNFPREGSLTWQATHKENK